MEYEQLENGNKVLHHSILSQDVGGFYELLHPSAILVTHFPYPDAATDTETAALSTLSPALALARAEGLGKLTPKRRKDQLLAEQAAVRATQEAKYQHYLQSRLDAAAAGGNRSSPKRDADTSTAAAAGGGGGGSVAPSPVAAAAAAEQPADPLANGASTTKGKSTATAKKAATAGSTSGSRVQAALQGRREHKGIVFYFHQPPPLEGMLAGGAGINPSDLWGGANPTAAAAGSSSTGNNNKNNNSGGKTAARGNGKTDASVAAAADGGAASAMAGGKANSLEGVVAAEYGEFVDVTEGRLLICERFCFLLNWINQEAYVADIISQLDPRKGVLQDAEVLPPPPLPRTPQETYASLGRMFTDRNQQVSRLTILWGREHLMFSDQLFFDDGLVICIHRRMLTLPEMLRCFPAQDQKWTLAQKTEKIREELKSFYGITRSRVAAVNHALPLLDFSFAEVGEHVLRLLTASMEPATGRRHVCRPERPVADPRFAQGVFLNADNDPTKGGHSNRTLIKAKNKQGDEEAYEFTANARQRYQVFGGTEGGGADDSFEDQLPIASTNPKSGAGSSGGGNNATNTAANMNSTAGRDADGRRRPFKYDATSLRISGCRLCMPSVDSYAQANSNGKMASAGFTSNRLGGGPGGGKNNKNNARKPIRFLSIIRGLVANAMLTLHSVDLSDNHLSVLPDLSLLPLQKLMLHGNNIDDWDEVEDKVCTLPFLSSVTLYGNPIADTDPKYWVQALSRLVRSPARKVPLKQLDFVTLTAQDLNQMGVRRV